MSANFLRIILCSLPLTLGACSNGDLPKWFTGEPSQDEINAYQGPITMPAAPASDAAWPNLADVPQRPVPKMKLGDRQTEIKSLKEENVTGQAMVNDFAKANPPPAKNVGKAKPVIGPKKSKAKKKKPTPPADDVSIPAPEATP